MLESRRGIWKVQVGQIVVQGHGIKFSRRTRLEDGFNFRGKNEFATGLVMRIEERLLAHMVGGEQHAMMPLVPQGEGKHAPQLFYNVNAPFFVAVDDNFSIAVGAEVVSRGNQFFAQVLEVVNFAVEGDPDGFIFIAHGLVPGRREIDDGEPAVLQAHPDGAFQQGKVFQPAIVRTAVMEFQPAFFVRGRTADLSKYATHDFYSTFAARSLYTKTGSSSRSHGRAAAGTSSVVATGSSFRSFSIICPRTTQASMTHRNPLTST